MISVVRQQHPVGQGGFHSARIEAGGTGYNYIYDCGSNQKSALERELRRIHQRDEGLTTALDALFLSHLDEDHVSGVDSLLAKVDVRTVVLPYLHPFERLALVAEACEREELTPDRLGMIVRPEEWFRERGVERIVFVLEGREPPPRPDLPEAPPAPDKRHDGIIKYDGPHEPSEEDRADSPRLPQDTLVLYSGEPLRVYADGRVVWLLVPHVHPEPERLKPFVLEVQRLTGIREATITGVRFGSWLKKLIRDRRKRAKLADAYRLIRRDRNLTSMSLYSGPAWRGANHASRSFAGRRCCLPQKAGWLSTGDSMLTRKARVDKLVERLSSLLPEVGTFVLPHHGSRHNFSATTLETSISGVLWIACSGPNSYGHPHIELLESLEHRGDTWTVTHQESTRLLEVVRVK
ncbi:MBL fold metallo-hydrolase [Myxococcus stipitatus]|uniref:MBL fold metallo-hydrolase n=1 Tax=Myxococcus stipitatus TaxID=83455 RepID=UPI003AF2E805